MKKIWLLAILLGVWPGAGMAQTTDELINDGQNTDNVLTQSMGYDRKSFSPLDQINRSNITRLVPIWNTSLMNNLGELAAPVVYNGVMYVINGAWTFAIDVETGRQIWRTPVTLEPETRRASFNRGAPTIYNGKLFRVTVDNHLLALDMETGEELWNQKFAESAEGYHATGAPIVADGVLISGMAGGESTTRGFLDGWDPETGTKLWRRYTIPAPGEPGSETWPVDGEAWKYGGGPTWRSGSYDPELDLVYWGTGNAEPYDPETRGGLDSLYTSSVLAIRPKTGEIACYFQYTPNDVYDVDGVDEHVLADIEIDGQPRQVMIQANKNGFLYVMDRTNCELLAANPYVKVNWATHYDFETGLVVVVGLVGSTQVGLMGQTAGAQADTSLRTPWGEPDLQGIWTEEFDTPLVRPEAYGNREFFTDEEYAEADNERARLLAGQTSDGGDRRSAPGSQNDVAGAYSNAHLSFKHLGRRTSLIVDPPNGRLPALTAEAQALANREREWRRELLRSTETCELELPACSGQEYNPTPSPRRAERAPRYNTNRMNRHDNPEDGAFGDRCLLGHPAEFGSAVGSFRRIVQTQGGVSMYYDVGQGQGFQRSIVMNGSPHLPETIRQWFGDSRAHWDGDTLVIDVTNFTPKQDFRGSRENLHLVERWTRTGPDTLAYEVTIEDPSVWVQPWTVKQEFQRQSDQENRIYYEPRCHEGNYGFPALLKGARVNEEAYAAGTGPHPATFDNATGSGIQRFPGSR